MVSHAAVETLSARGEAAARSMVPVFLDVINDSFTPDNSGGFISLGLAENV
jgi:hypothetical protein